MNEVKTIQVSVLQDAQPPDPDLQETLKSIEHLRLLKGARDPETFLHLYNAKPPDLVLVELNGNRDVPGWVEQVIERLPRSRILICSRSRDPDFLIQVTKLRIGGFIPLPLNREDMLATLARIRLEKAQNGGATEGQILAVTGTKGGVGVTTVAVNLAVALAERLGGGVMLVDLARPFPQAGQFLDLKSTHTIMDLAESPESLDPLFLEKVVQKHESGLEVLLGQPLHHPQAFAELPDPQSLGKIFHTLQSSHDWIVVDLGTSLDLLHVLMLQRADQVLLVTELNVPHLQNLKNIRTLWPEWNLEESALKVVVNRYVKDYSLGLKDVERICFQPAFFTLPNDYASLREALNQGMALGELAPRSKLWRSLKDLAGKLVTERQLQTAKQAAARPGFFRRLLHKER
ncbi:MAG: AAA family ATPase [Thermodesulfobacteriota bacterium]